MRSECPDTAELMIRFIDEMIRGHSRFNVFSDEIAIAGSPQGTAGTVLTAVVRAKSPPTVPQIGRSLGFPRQTIQRHADWLASHGYVEFVANPDHKLAKRLVPTQLGRDVYAAQDARAHEWARRFTQDLDPEALRLTVETMAMIRHRLERLEPDHFVLTSEKSDKK